jgi:hypothetical protein
MSMISLVSFTLNLSKGCRWFDKVTTNGFDKGGENE